MAELVSASGQPLIKEVNLIVLKSEQPISKELANSISSLTKCAVVNLPMNTELLKGNTAAKELSFIHNMVHAVMQLPPISFDPNELNIVKKALDYTIRSMHIDRNAAEGRLLGKISEVVK